MTVRFEIKCPQFKDLLKGKEILGHEVYWQQQKAQICLNNIINTIRAGLMNDRDSVRVSIDAIANELPTQTAVKYTLKENGFEITELPIDKSDTITWEINLKDNLGGK